MQSDQLTALRILADVRQFAQRTGREEAVEELYWPLLAAAAGLLGLGVLCLRERAQLWWQLGAGLAVAAALWNLG